MNMLTWTFFASFADAIRALHCIQPSGFPANAIGARRTTTPTGMGIGNIELRLPFSHATPATKRSLRVKVTSSPAYFFPAPFTQASCLIASFRVSATYFGFLGALPTACLLRTLASAGSWLATHNANTVLATTPTGLQIATRRAISRIISSVLRVKGLAATLAVSRNVGVLHSLIIPLEERYCEIAAKRLQQEAFDFGEAA